MREEGRLDPKRYFLGFVGLLLLIAGEFWFGPKLNVSVWKGVAVSLVLSFASYSIRFFLLSRNFSNAVSAQLGTNVLFFFIQMACLLAFLSRGEGEGFVIGFFIAHFANLLILVFAR
ncbi:hypothetical protein EHO60_10200 [Leptospira fletcheri]|uniref:DUF2568 domain-containing protein n=1 Tax=Leptospira fletcheri TaxID=2484981 RepID=A0A4R9GEE0_9LEPT|nr:hypothetical protein EHO60_10200 [Leptospira fletcheri]